MKSITHKCKQNDAVIKVYFEDNAIDELQIKIQGEKGWIVIGYMDLQKAISSAVKRMGYIKNEKHTNNSGGYIGEAETENKRINRGIYSECKYGCKNPPY